MSPTTSHKRTTRTEAPPMLPLRELLDRPLYLGSFLELAAAITGEVARLHRQKLAHGAITPDAILIAPGTAMVALAGVPAAGAPAQSWRSGPPPPEYMSPEQTGRLNRPADYRTDFYSLGVTFYRMLTGTLPYQGGDLVEWVYNHIARVPAAPRELLPELPPVVSDLIMKLLAKNPEERYQSAEGLRDDLEKALRLWREHLDIPRFPLGEGDVPERLTVPAKLYGREREVAALVEAFHRVAHSGASEMVLVAGYSGVGKSSLVQELYPLVVRGRGYFIAGKFDRYRGALPYATIAGACRELLRQVLTESEERIEKWAVSLREALGGYAGLIAELVPELEVLIGPQPPVPGLSAAEAQQRVIFFLRRFLGVFAAAEHPLLLFLDDLQWSDAGTLALVQELLSAPGTAHLLLVGAYRDNEVSPPHPLLLALDDLRRRGARLQTLTLSPLSPTELGALLADTLRGSAEAVQPLTALVAEKTAGNPFFLIQFLAALDEEGLIRFDREARHWRWDLPSIRARNYTENVAQLVVGRLERLPQQTRRALTTGACLGDRFDLATLALLEEQGPEAVEESLRAAEREGVLLRLHDDYKFLHDRVREAAYAQVPEERKGETHLRIGKILWARLGEQELGERIFEVVSHLNLGVALLREPEERQGAAALNLKAGKKAKGAGGYAQAGALFACGRALLGEGGWQAQHGLMFALTVEQGECDFLTGNFAQAGRLLQLALQRGVGRQEKAAAYRVLIELYTVNGEVEQAVEETLACAALFGLSLRRHPPEETVRAAYDKVMDSLGGRAIEDLFTLPRMSDHEVCTFSEVLMAASPAVTNYDHRLHFALIAETVSLSVRFGCAPCSVAAYVHFGSVIGPLLGEYGNGYRFGKLAYDLVARDGLVQYQARTCAMFAYGIIPWTRHVGEALEYLRKGLLVGSESGDLIFACYASACIISVLIARGDRLEEIDAEAERMLDFVTGVGYGDVVDALLVQRRFVQRLRGMAALPGEDQPMSEALDLRILERFPTSVYLYHVTTLREQYLLGTPQRALQAAGKADDLSWTATHLWESCEHSYYLALTVASLGSDAAPEQREEHLAALRQEVARYGVWAQNAPQNFENRHALLAAEAARLEGRDQEAMQLYERAVASARENRFPQNEAIASETAASFYQQRGLTSVAQGYLRQARACYLRWGAGGKVRQLDRRHPWLKEEAPHPEAAAGAAAVDAITVVKGTRAISGEIVLENLVETLMRIVLENAGAQKGYLLLSEDEELAVEAYGVLQGDAISVSRGAPAPLAEIMPRAVIDLARRTRERVILDDARQPNRFSADSYLAQHKPLSVLCLPVLRRSELAALLYLENNLVTGAFTAERVGVLEALAAQAALSLENARVYEALRQAEAKYRSIFQNALEGIFQSTPGGRYLDANPAMARILGYDSPAHLMEQVTNIRQQLYVDPQQRDHVVQLLTEQDYLAYETRLYRRDGSVIWVLINARSVRDNDGRVLYYEGIVEDITQRKAAEQELHQHRQHLEQLVRDRTLELEKANTRLRELDRLKSMFIASMSHELRTPLNSIIGFTGMTLEGLSGSLNAEQEDNLSRVYQSAQHLLELITDIIDISKIESGRIDTFVEPVQLDEIVEEATSTVAPAARQKGLILEVEVAQGVLLATDHKRLLQCLINLLGNAVKFTEKGMISVSARPSDGFVEFAVADTGIGIAKEDLPRLFEPFERLESHLRVKAGGSGLGLYLTRKLAHDVLHGTVSVESREGEGSVFTLRIPLELAPAAEEVGV